MIVMMAVDELVMGFDLSTRRAEKEEVQDNHRERRIFMYLSVSEVF